ncbi:MAG: hypothetical protein J6T88_02970 [Bacteroidales bacterium]|nr:hypothetical protein [Bacteroidales bacterium]
MESDGRFQEGAILYFDPFIFSDGGSPKPKYFLVLKVMDDACLLASLPTSKDHVPEYIEKRHDCIERSDISFNCYYFDPTVVICDNGFSFPVETYVYGFRLQTFNINDLLLQEVTDETTIEECGILTDSEYQALVHCLTNSPEVKRGYRKLLSE